jgi:putative membrane protein
MKDILDNEEKSRLEESVKKAEVQTGAQIVLAVVRRSDNYPEVPWKAFASGVSLASLTFFVIYYFSGSQVREAALLFPVAAVLVAGAMFAVLAVIITPFARLFISRNRKETEAFQYAGSLFLSRGLYETKKRDGILLLVSIFERRVVLMPDTGVRELLSDDVIKSIISVMIPLLKKKRVGDAMKTGLDGITDAIGTSRTTKPGLNELSDKIIEEDRI